MLPSGFARSLTRPEATGSGTTVKTIGIVSVAAFAARAATAPLAKMRATRAFVSSSAAVDTALRSPRVNRMSKARVDLDRKSTRLNSSHSQISYAVFCLKKKHERCLHGLRVELDASRIVV